MTQRRVFVLGFLLLNAILIGVSRFTLPGNTVILDWVILVCLPVLWLHIAYNRVPVRFPLFWPMWLIIGASLLATTVSPAPLASLSLIIKEVYLYLWFVTLVVILSNYISPRTFQRILMVWVVAASAQALFIILQFTSPSLRHATTIGVGKYVSGADRPLGLFKNPNMAASFLLVSLFLAALLRPPAKWPRAQRLVTMALSSLVLIGGILATGSRGVLAAAFSGLIATGLSFLAIERKSGHVVRLLAIGTVALTVLILVAQSLIFSNLADTNLAFFFQKRYSNDLFRESLERRLGWSEAGLAALSSSNYLGVGPDIARLRYIPDSKSMHNDLLSFLVERGILGFLALLMFVSFVAARVLRRMGHVRRTGESARDIAVLVGGCAAIATLSMTHQAFHFRHVWFFLAVLFTIHLRGFYEPYGVETMPRLQSQNRARVAVYAQERAARSTQA